MTTTGLWEVAAFHHLPRTGQDGGLIRYTFIELLGIALNVELRITQNQSVLRVREKCRRGSGTGDLAHVEEDARPDRNESEQSKHDPKDSRRASGLLE